MQKTIALAAVALSLAITDGNTTEKKKSKPAPETSQGISPSLRDQAKSQAPTVGGRNGCTSWHIQSGAPC